MPQPTIASSPTIQPSLELQISPPPEESIPQSSPESETPAGWKTYRNEKYKYSLAYSQNLELSEENPYSTLLNPAGQKVGVPNFYVSVIPDGFWENGAIYNYPTPDFLNNLLSIKIGEEKSLISNLSEWNTFKRLADIIIDGEKAMVYENIHPWQYQGTERRILIKKSGFT